MTAAFANVYFAYVFVAWMAYLFAFRRNWRLLSMWAYDLFVLAVVLVRWMQVFPLLKYTGNPLSAIGTVVKDGLHSYMGPIAITLIIANVARFFLFRRVIARSKEEHRPLDTNAVSRQ